MNANDILLAMHASAAELAEAESMKDRMQAVRERAGNPEGVEIVEQDGMLRLFSRSMPWPQFNTVKGVHEGVLERLDDLERYYRERERPVRLELSPQRITSALLQELGRRGYRTAALHAGLYRLFAPKEAGIEVEPSSGSGLTIRQAGLADAEAYARIHCLSTGLGESGIPSVRANNEVLMERPGWSFWIAERDGEPAAVGVMRISGGAANLSFAATLPEERGRGLQQALLLARLEAARAAGCLIAVSQCEPYSISMRNMQRCGMRLAFIRPHLMLPHHP